LFNADCDHHDNSHYSEIDHDDAKEKGKKGKGKQKKENAQKKMKEKGKHIREEIRVQPEQRKKRKIKRPALYWKPGGVVAVSIFC
jgi:hypothetical protein